MKYCPMTMSHDSPKKCLREWCAWWKDTEDENGECSIGLLATEMFLIVEMMFEDKKGKTEE